MASIRLSLIIYYVAANKRGAALFVSIHHNAYPGGYGSEVLCIKGNFQGGLSTKAGEAILKELVALRFRNRGVKNRMMDLKL